MKREELAHHTPEQVRCYVHEAEAILQEAGYDDAERVALLPTIIKLLGEKTINFTMPAPIGVRLADLDLTGGRRQ